MPTSPAVSEPERPTTSNSWWAALRPAQLVPKLITGVVLGGLVVTFSISLATLIYGTLLPEHLDRAIGLALFGTLAVGLLATLLGSHPGVVVHLQDAPAAILATAATAIVAGAVAGGAGATIAGDTLPIFMTVAATVALSTLVTGAVLLLFGLFRLGRMVRYLPYPVIGGFMAGTGWLLFSGGLAVMTGGHGSLPELVRPGSIVSWLPGTAFAALLLCLSRAVRSYLVWPAAVVAAGAIFYAVAFVSGANLEGWRANGLLLGPFPDADLAQGLGLADLALVDWPVVMAQLPTVFTVAGISLLAVLLSSSAIEVTLDRRVDLNRELRTTGLGNLLAGTLGGQVGYHSLSLTALNARAGAGAGGRAPILIALVAVAAALWFGAGLLDYVPTFMIGGLVAFLGLDFLYTWLVEEYRRLTKTEYAVVVVILVLVGVAGFLPGVALGLFLTVVLFVVNYSRVDAVRHALSGAELRSRVRRDPEEQRLVAAAGKEVLVLQLQGFLFFGTTNSVLERIQQRQEEGRLRAVILDFRRVTGVDASATVALRRLLSRAAPPGAVAGAASGGHDVGGYRLYLTELSAAVRADFERRGLADQLAEQVTLFPALDAALEATEGAALSRPSSVPRPQRGDRAPSSASAATPSSEAPTKGDEPSDEPTDGTAALAVALGPDVDATALRRYLTRFELAAAERLITQGDQPDAVYFVASGRLSTWLRPQSGADTRLESMRSGSVVGEIGFFTGELRSASVVADEPTIVYRLSRQALTRFAAAEPTKAQALTESLARLMAERIRHLMTAVEALQR